MLAISNKENKTEEMEKYEEETGKKAIWRGIITDGFKKWQKGEKVYIEGKERINVLISEERKNKWLGFVKESDIATISKLVRTSVEFYMDSKSKTDQINEFLNSSHHLKEELSSIKGFSQMLMEEYKDELSWDVLLKIKEIFDKSINIENIINNILNVDFIGKDKYDVLIIDDDDSTVFLISEFFKKKGYSYRETSLGNRAIEILQKSIPKLVLLDVLLPDSSGYDICKTIKTDKKLKNIPVFYITAVPETEVYEKTKESGANGYFLKPFNMLKFKSLLEFL